MPTISLFFVLLSTSFLLCGGLIAWIFLDRRHRRASQQQEQRMTQQVLQHSALCEDLEVRISSAIAAFGRNEDSFRGLLMERNGLIEQLESAIASYENAATGHAPDAGLDARRQGAAQDASRQSEIASSLSGGVLGVCDWEQQIETLQAEKHAELARQSETIAGLTERVQALAEEAQQARLRAAESAESAQSSGQREQSLQVELDESQGRYEALEERAADEASTLTDDLEDARAGAQERSELAAALEQLRDENAELRETQLAASGVADEQLDSLRASSEELSERADRGAQALLEAQTLVGELQEYGEALEAEIDVQQVLAGELQANLVEHGAQAAEWQAANTALVEESARLATELEDASVEQEVLKVDLSRRIGLLIAERDHLAQNLGSREMAMAELTLASSAAGGERDDAQRRLEALEERLSSQARDLTGVRAEMARLAGEVEQAEQAIRVQEHEAQRTGDTVREQEQLASQELSQLRDELEQQASGHAQRLEQANADHMRQQARVGDFEQQVAELEAQARERQDQLEVSRSTAHSLADQITEFEGALAQAGAERETLDVTLQHQSNEIEQKAGSLADLQSALGGLEALVETMTDSAAARDEELVWSGERIHGLEASRQESADALAEVSEREAFALEQMAGLSESLTAVGIERDTASGKLAEEHDNLERLRGEHVQVRGDLKQQVQACAELEAQLDERGQQHQAVSLKLAARGNDLEQLRGEHAHLGEALSEVRSSLEQKQVELAKAKNALAARDSSFETAQDLLADLGPIFETLQSQLDKKNVLTALQSELRKPLDDNA